MRSLALAALCLAVASAQAVTFNFRSRGTDARAGTSFNVADATFSGAIGAAPAGYSFVSLSYGFDASFAGTSLVGSVLNGKGRLTLRPTMGADRILTFDFSGTASRPSGTSLDRVSISTASFALSGAGLAGAGRLSSNLTASGPGALDGRSQTTFLSNFETVPEPASMAALAVGALGLLRRRRKA